MLSIFYRPDLSNQTLPEITLSMELLQDSSDAETTRPVLLPEQSTSQKRQSSRAPKRRLNIESAASGTPAIKRLKNPEVLKAPFFKIVKVQYGKSKMIKKMIVFSRDNPELCYEYSLGTSAKREYYYCRRCTLQGKYVQLRLFKDTANGDYVKLSTTLHRCKPQIYDSSNYSETNFNVSTSQPDDDVPPEVDEESEKTLLNNMAAAEVPVTQTIPENAEKLIDYKFDTFSKSDSSKTKYLTIIAPNNKDVCYTFYYENSKHVYQCIECRKLSKHVCVKLYQNEANELFFEYGNNEHVCFPRSVAITVEAANFEIKKDLNGNFKNLTVFTSGNRELCYRYHWNKGNYFRCSGCYKYKSCIAARLYEKETGEYYVKMDNHICEPII